MNENLCRRCVWSDKISKEKAFCMFPSCVIKVVKVKEEEQDKEKKSKTKVKRKGGRSCVSKKAKKTMQTSRVSKANGRKVL